MKQLERRVFTLPAEVRSEGETRKIFGHAAVFNALSVDLGGFREKIAPGAFAASIAKDDVRALFNHDSNFVLGRNTSGTLTLKEDEEGLAYAVTPPDTTWARDLLVSVERRDISQNSFGFYTLSDEWNRVEGELVRTLLAVELFDVSVVTYPAYPQTDAAVRSMAEYKARQEQDKVPPAVHVQRDLWARRFQLHGFR